MSMGDDDEEDEKVFYLVSLSHTLSGMLTVFKNFNAISFKKKKKLVIFLCE